jgi:hypothetical protein
MALIVFIDLVAIIVLWRVAVRRGFEQALPFAAFMLLLLPNASQIPLPGLFDLTTHRIIVIVLLILNGTLPKPTQQSQRPLPLKYLLLVQIIWWFLSATQSVVFSISLKTVLSQLFDFYAVYYLFATRTTTIETVHRTFKAFVMAMLLCSICGAIEANTGWSVVSWFPATASHFDWIGASGTDRGIRVKATFGHPILYGGALAMVVPMALYLLTLAATTKHKVLLWGAILLMFQNIYKTGSRGPWIALTASLGIMLLFGASGLRKPLMTIALLTATVLVARPGVWISIRDLYLLTNDADSAQGQSYQYRYDLYRTAKKELAKNIGRSLWGYGPESFYYLGLQGEFEGHLVPYESCDSSVVALMIETGYLGFLTVAAYLLAALWRTVRNCVRLDPPHSSLALVMTVNLMAFYFLMTNVAIFGWGQQSYVLWIVLGIAVVLPRLAGETTLDQTAVDIVRSPWGFADSEAQQAWMVS